MMRRERQISGSPYSLRYRGRFTGKPFLPNKFSGLNLWLDASDAASVTSASGTASKWADKSGNNYHATQGTVLNQPGYGARTVNGKNALFFDGSNDRLDIAAGFYGISNSDSTCFAVYASDNIAATAQRIIGATDGGTARWYIARDQSLGAAQACARSSNTPSSITGLPTNTGQQLGVLLKAGIIVNAYYNSTKGPDAVGSNFTATNFQVGATTNGNFFNGVICEIICYNRALSASEIATVSAYLKTKWALP